MKNNAKEATQNLIWQVLESSPITTAQAKKVIFSIGVRAAAKYLRYHSMKALYRWNNSEESGK